MELDDISEERIPESIIDPTLNTDYKDPYDDPNYKLMKGNMGGCFHACSTNAWSS